MCVDEDYSFSLLLDILAKVKCRLFILQLLVPHSTPGTVLSTRDSVVSMANKVAASWRETHSEDIVGDRHCGLTEVAA